MKYFGVVAIMDDVPDTMGDTLSENVTLPTGPVSVTQEFEKVIGIATVFKVKNLVLSEIDIDSSIMPTEFVQQFTPVVHGCVLTRDGNRVTSWRLDSVALTTRPCDRRLPRLQNWYGMPTDTDFGAVIQYQNLKGNCGKFINSAI